jgi:predicted RNA-binding protein with RPS1 domain
MASVCGGVLALMDAGVPLTRPVAGISIGICTEYDKSGKIDRYELLTDIIGWEDAFCDMDCKIAGTEKGITGFQLDLKLKGLPHKLMAEAVEAARQGRMTILAEMAKTLAEPRAELSRYAPRIVSIKINPEKIGALIGPGGKNIKRIVEESGCEINIDDDGTVNIYSTSEEGMKVAKAAVEGMTAEIEIDKIYRGKVVSIKDFGCFVEVFPGKDGLVHISELANFRVKQTEDIVKIGDEIWVKCIGIDEKGRVKLSRRAAMEERDREMSGGGDNGGGEVSAPSAPEETEESEDVGIEPDVAPTGDPEFRPRERAPRSDRGPREPREPRTPREPREPRGGDRPSRSMDRGDRGSSDRGPRDYDRGGERSRGGDRGERPPMRERAPMDRGDRGPRDDRGGRGGDRDRGPRDTDRDRDRGGRSEDRGGSRDYDRPRESDRGSSDRGPRDYDRPPARSGSDRDFDRPPERGGDRDISDRDRDYPPRRESVRDYPPRRGGGGGRGR